MSNGRWYQPTRALKTRLIVVGTGHRPTKAIAYWVSERVERLTRNGLGGSFDVTAGPLSSRSKPCDLPLIGNESQVAVMVPPNQISTHGDWQTGLCPCHDDWPVQTHRNSADTRGDHTTHTR